MNTALIVIISVAVLAVAALIIYAFQSRRHSRKAGLRDLYTEGLDFLISGHLKKAYMNFRDIVQQDTGNVNAYLKLGQAAREGGNPEQALKIHASLKTRNLNLYEQIELDKSLALDYYAGKNLAAAAAAAARILSMEKKNDWALSHLVKFCREMEDWGKAGEYLAQLQKITGQQDARKLALYKIQEGRTELKKRNFSQARTLFEQALKMEKTLGAAHYFIGCSYVLESEQAYQSVEEIDARRDRTDQEQKQLKSAMDKARQKLGLALHHWVMFSEMEPEQSWLVIARLKDALFALDRYHEIESILKTIIRNDPDNSEALASLAEFYHHKGENREALDRISIAVEKNPESLIVQLIQYKLQLFNDPSPETISKIDRLIEFAHHKKYHQFRDQDESDIRWLLESSGDLELLVV